jgi:hypothetical protein
MMMGGFKNVGLGLRGDIVLGMWTDAGLFRIFIFGWSGLFSELYLSNFECSAHTPRDLPFQTISIENFN